LSEALAGAVRAAGFDLIRPSIPGGANGTTGFAPHLVTVETALSAGQAIKTLAHELAHVLLHTDAEDTAGCRTRVEAEAESVAHIVCQAVRLATGGYSFGYVARWSGGDRRPSRRPPSES
jgi:cation diffusion facilitator CzcD-associated flavoprotein CzcO